MRSLLACLLLTGCGSAVAIPDDSLDDATADSTSADSAITTPDTATTPDAPRAETPIATDGGRPLNCSDPSTFPKFEKGCSSTENCSFGLHQVDCCGTRFATGLNHAERARFEEIEKAWQSICPMCDCLEKPTMAEDGRTGTSFGVRCVEGQCRTYVR